LVPVHLDHCMVPWSLSRTVQQVIGTSPHRLAPPPPPLPFGWFSGHLRTYYVRLGAISDIQTPRYIIVDVSPSSVSLLSFYSSHLASTDPILSSQSFVQSVHPAFVLLQSFVPSSDSAPLVGHPPTSWTTSGLTCSYPHVLDGL
jgi:hypothetical protein